MNNGVTDRFTRGARRGAAAKRVNSFLIIAALIAALVFGSGIAAFNPAAAAAGSQARALFAYAEESATSSPAITPEKPKPPKVVRVKAPKRAKGVFVIDVTTGKTLSAKNADKSLPAASTSKLMTAWLVAEKIASGKGDWSDKVRITDSALDHMSRIPVYGGAIRLKKGRIFTVKQLFQMTLVESHNAASVQLGRWVAGSDKKFAKLMNKAADELGMKNSYFVNACGLENIDYDNDLRVPYVGKRSETNRMSPRDAAKLGAAIVTKHPVVMGTTKLAKVKVKGKTIWNSNRILFDKALKKKAKGLNVNGLKTGYIRISGRCLIGTAKMKGRHRIVTVIFNGPNMYEDTISLMKRAYKANPKAV